MSSPDRSPAHDVDDEDSTRANPRFDNVLDARLRGGACCAAASARPRRRCSAASASRPGRRRGRRRPGHAHGANGNAARFHAGGQVARRRVSVPAGYTASVSSRSVTRSPPARPPTGTTAPTPISTTARATTTTAWSTSACRATGARRPDQQRPCPAGINHEATSNRDVRSYYLHPNGGTRTRAPPARPTRRCDVHGISVVEVRKTAGAWPMCRIRPTTAASRR